MYCILYGEIQNAITQIYTLKFVLSRVKYFHLTYLFLKDLACHTALFNSYYGIKVFKRD